jgi:aromatic ring-cleaving dioxygenase
MPPQSTSEFQGYHAHVYFDAATRDVAWSLRERAQAELPAAIGRFHEKPVGPHPRWSFQIAFAPDALATVLPWLIRNRAGLTVFLHALSGDELVDHTDYAVWMGDMPALDLSTLS